MGKSLAIIGAVAVSFGLGFFLAEGGGAPGSDEEPTAPLDIPVALQRSWLPPISEYDTRGESLDDERFDELLSRLEAALTAEETLADFGTEAEAHFDGFIRRVTLARLTDEQKDRASSYLEEMADRNPDHRSMIEQQIRWVEFYAASSSSGPPISSIFWIVQTAFGSDNIGEPFDDAQVDGMLATLDAIVSVPDVAADLEHQAELAFWSFNSQLQTGRLSEAQSARIGDYLDELRAEHADAAEFIDRQRFFLDNLIPGGVAPNIVGHDTEGVEFALEDYRGRIAVVIFSGQWCGPCRGEYPYQRAMLDLFEDEDVALLGVNSDALLETAIEAKKEERLDFRTWWDGRSQPDAEVAATEGPIATEWNVSGWPTIYVIDEEGVIRHVNKRGGELIAAVDRLLMDKRMRAWDAEREAEEAEAEATDDADAETEAENAGDPASEAEKGQVP